MARKLVDWTYNEDGEIIDVYLFKSEILEIPTTEADILDMATAARLAELEAKKQDGDG